MKTHYTPFKLCITLTALVALLVSSIFTFGRNTTPVYAGPLAQPSPRPPAFGGSGEDEKESGDKKPSQTGEIRGIITDLSTGSPGVGLDVEINGMIVRSDGRGFYSLTGLAAGDYTVTLVLPNDYRTNGSQTIFVPHQGVIEVDLQYYSQQQPTSTPIPTPAHLPETGEQQGSGITLLIISGIIILSGVILLANRRMLT